MSSSATATFGQRLNVRSGQTLTSRTSASISPSPAFSPSGGFANSYGLTTSSCSSSASNPCSICFGVGGQPRITSPPARQSKHRPSMRSCRRISRHRHRNRRPRQPISGSAWRARCAPTPPACSWSLALSPAVHRRGGRSDEAQPVTFQIIECVVQRMDFQFAAVAGAGIDLADRQAPAEPCPGSLVQGRGQNSSPLSSGGGGSLRGFLSP